MEADDDDKAAVAKAAMMGSGLAAAVDCNDAEGFAAREAVTAFAAKAAELDALLADSDDEPLLSRIGAWKLDFSEDDSPGDHNEESDWQLRSIGLEVQRPYAKLLLAGSKTVETRRYALPSALVGRPISVLETSEATADVSSLPDEVPAGCPAVHLVGTLTFGSCFQYKSMHEWRADEVRHGAPPNSPYAWSEDRPVFGWVVESAQAQEQVALVPALTRRFRSFFEICSGKGIDDVKMGASAA